MSSSDSKSTGAFNELDFPSRLYWRAFLQDAFLNAVVEHTTEVFEDLVKTVFAVFLELGEFERMEPWREIKSQSSTNARIKAVRDSMTRWSERWNLNTEWWCERCYNELMMQYHRSSNPGRRPVPFDDNILDSVFASERCELSVPSSLEGLKNYLPIGQTRKEYLQYVEGNSLKAFEANPLLTNVEASQRAASIKSIVSKAEAYCATVERCYLNGDYIPSKKVRSFALHLEWLVRVVVKRQTLSEVADAEGVEVPAVSKPIYKLLEQLDLPKPPHLKRGRVQGSKNRTTKIQRDLGR